VSPPAPGSAGGSRNESGELGYGRGEVIGDDESPASAGPIPLGDEPGEMPPPDVDVGGRAIQISAGSHHPCAVLEDGGVRCRGGGDGLGGLLGYGRAISLDDPPALAGDVPLYPKPPAAAGRE